MADATAEEIEEEPKKSKLPLILSVVALLVGAGGGFFASYTGLLFGSDEEPMEKDPGLPVEPIPDVAYLPIDPMVVSIGRMSEGRHLRFNAQLEVPKEYQADVKDLMPRIVDVLNGYLRAIELADLDNPSALVRLRAHMLRRIQIVTGKGRVSDLLVMEFVLN